MDGLERGSPEQKSVNAENMEGLDYSLHGHRLLIGSLFLPYTLEEETLSSPTNNTEASSPRSSQSALSYPDTSPHIPHITTRRNTRTSTSPATKPSKDHPDAPSQFTVFPSPLGNIGLQNAVKSVSDQLLGTVYWIGLTGCQSDTWSDQKREVASAKLYEYDCLPVFAGDDETEGHYHQFCKQVLWKPFHYQLPEYPKAQSYEVRAWKHYVTVNEKFAERIAEICREGDTVWINDYHLMLVPSMLRKRLPTARIGFFLHIPFPSSEIFRCLHVRKEILEGLLGADLVGFQTYSFMRHFLMTATRILGVESTPRGILLDKSNVTVGIFPIGIDLVTLNEKRANPEVFENTATLAQKYAGMKVLIGRDKNDYVKGVRQKLLAYERFLQLHPQWIGKVILIQVALPTTQANETEAQVQDVVARINSKHGSIEYIPVVYFQQDISFSQYLALLTVADACLVTSLRDGMNLTSHEYIACQSKKKSPLIISEFAGTYGSFGAAIRVNPWNVTEVAEAIHEALIMPVEEKSTRWKELYDHVRANSAQNYVTTFLGQLGRVHEEMLRTLGGSIPKLPTDVVLAELRLARKRMFFLDHDGTIVRSGGSINDYIPPNRLNDLLHELTADPKNIVYIMSGRTKDALSEFMHIPHLGLSAENGCFVKWADKTTWENMLPDINIEWKASVLEIFEYYTDRTPGSTIEQREASINPSFGAWQASECQNHIESSLSPVYPIHCLLKRKSLEVVPRSTNKGIVVKRALEHHQHSASTVRKLHTFPNPSPTSKPQDSQSRSRISAMWLDSDQQQREEARGVAEPVETPLLSTSPSLPAIDLIRGRRDGSEHSYTHSHSTSSNTSSTREHHNNSKHKHHVYHPTQHQKPQVAFPQPSHTVPVDFVFAIGDDRADEYMFEYLHELERESSSASTTTGNATPQSEPVDQTDINNSLVMTPLQSPILQPTIPRSPILAPIPRSPHVAAGDEHLPTTPSNVHRKGVPHSVLTVTVGSKSSNAKWFLPNSLDVVALLDTICEAVKSEKHGASAALFKSRLSSDAEGWVDEDGTPSSASSSSSGGKGLGVVNV
ncbi:hypothetical protein SmJEL517_g00258 [Synchytrium microbalum]|uniref:Uncharacterized protein n=1 Tax=Synchytrium microbalum TaxID=1806994 RepID=A0A507CIK6_9FUNG|nr:uncharacterized protein SmJEL517_g00258 [Synchytrium microbalum]TPX37974.1 hypothetical protein SmJEL517_g00258 [Synchytrium microbalum]